MSNYTQLTNISDFTRSGLNQQIEENLVEWLRYGLADAGGFSSVGVTTPGVADAYGGEVLTLLHKEGEPADGRIWQAPNTDWVYEAAFESGRTPTPAAGVYVNGTFYPTATTTGAFAHVIDFPHGRVVFAAPIATTSLVQAAYSYRHVSLYDQNVPWFRQVVSDGFLTEAARQSTGIGVVELLNDYRVQTPLVVVEALMRRRQDPLELGSRARWISQDVLFHIVADSKADRDNIMDAISTQQDTSIYLYDVNARRAADDYSLDWQGSPRAGARSYPQLVAAPPDGYRWKTAFFSRMTGTDVSLYLPLFQGIVRATLVVDFNGI